MKVPILKSKNNKTVFDIIYENIIEHETNDGQENKVAEKFKDWVLQFRSHREEVLYFDSYPKSV